MNITQRFLKYVSFDTQSEGDVATVPSTEKQWALARLLAQELTEMGAKDVTVSEHAYVYATIPATTKKELPTLGFIAHMDTAPACSGKDIKPQIIPNYDGGEITLNKQLGITMSPAQFPELSQCKGTDLIVTDGTTLLGADDKAGIAEIMTMAEHLLTHTEIPHGTIKIAFTPDEEVGNGPEFFDVKGFGANFAYTVDGGALGELEYENFNAAGARVTVYGKSVHPGSAKNKMVNALLVAMELQRLLPAVQNPAHTEGYEGFFHLDEMHGNVEKVFMDYIIRDHDPKKFEEKKVYFARAVEYLNSVYGKGTIDACISDSYRNMKEQILPHFHLIDNAKHAMEDVGITPLVTPIRGGTDGARLSFMGLPCPNLCTGGLNFHGPYECIPVQSMEKVVELLLRIVEIYSQ